MPLPLLSCATVQLPEFARNALAFLPRHMDIAASAVAGYRGERGEQIDSKNLQQKSV